MGPSPYREISSSKLQELAESTPTISIKWLPSDTTKIEHARTLIERIPIKLAQRLSEYCGKHIKNPSEFADTEIEEGHAAIPLVIEGGNGKAFRLIFEWIQGHAAGFDLLDDYQFDIAPLHQCHKLRQSADFLGCHAIRPRIWDKIEKVKKEPFRYSDAIPLLLANDAQAAPYKYVVQGVCEMIMDDRIKEDDHHLMVMRRHFPVFAVDVDDALESKKIATALPQGLWTSNNNSNSNEVSWNDKDDPWFSFTNQNVKGVS